MQGRFAWDVWAPRFDGDWLVLDSWVMNVSWTSLDLMKQHWHPCKCSTSATLTLLNVETHELDGFHDDQCVALCMSDTIVLPRMRWYRRANRDSNSRGRALVEVAVIAVREWRGEKTRQNLRDCTRMVFQVSRSKSIVGLMSLWKKEIIFHCLITSLLKKQSRLLHGLCSLEAPSSCRYFSICSTLSKRRGAYEPLWKNNFSVLRGAVVKTLPVLFLHPLSF